MRKFGLALLLLALGLMLPRCSVFRAGIGRDIEPHAPEAGCQLVTGPRGAEDVTFDPRTGIAYVSAHDRRAQWCCDEDPSAGCCARARGGIYAYDPRTPQATPVELSAGYPGQLRPHGIGLWTGSDPARLFVVNHLPEGRHAVEIFELRADALTHVETVESADGALISPNDVIPVGTRSFYVTNDHGARSGFGKMVEDLFGLGRASVLYYDGAAFRTVASGLGYANGVAVSPDGKTLWVAATVDRALHVYRRDPATGSLEPERSVKLKTGVDNIELDEAGRLWIGAHPKMLEFLGHARKAEHRSPSQVLRLTPRPDGDFDVAETYLNDGTPLSGSSVAAVHGRVLLVGSVFEGILRCPLPAEP